MITLAFLGNFDTMWVIPGEAETMLGSIIERVEWHMLHQLAVASLTASDPDVAANALIVAMDFLLDQHHDDPTVKLAAADAKKLAIRIRSTHEAADD